MFMSTIAVFADGLACSAAMAAWRFVWRHRPSPVLNTERGTKKRTQLSP
jgi:hypothetical protein